MQEDRALGGKCDKSMIFSSLIKRFGEEGGSSPSQLACIASSDKATKKMIFSSLSKCCGEEGSSSPSLHHIES